jgi:glycosyltransferase involved in cell wall biosynthesis
MHHAGLARTGAVRRTRAEPLPAKRRLCFVALHAWPVLARDPRIATAGGAEVQQAILARLFARHGYAVSMITLDHGQPEGDRVDGVTVYKAFAPRAGVPVLRVLHPRLTALWSALARADADIYYFRSVSMWLRLITEFCRRRGRRAVYAGASDKDFVADIGGQLHNPRDRWLYRRGLATVDAIVAQNEFQRASCLENYGREAGVIPSCYEPPQISNQEKNLVLWVGMLHENKRPELFLELAARLPHRRFVMIGGPRAGARSFYEGIRARAAGLANVEATGFLPLAEVETWFDRARVLVNTSIYEGMPNTFLQAWARGVPTVATVQAGGGFFCETADQAAAQIERLFTDEDHWRAQSRACRARFEERHSPALVLAHYRRLFEALAA